MTLFPRENFVGTFGGFAERGLEFHAEIVVPYQASLGQRPVQGHFVLVALEGDSEGILGRITNVQSQGRLTSSIGEDYVTRAAVEDREVPDDLRERYLKYKVDIRNLGVLRERSDGTLIFVPSHRRMPHVGAKVGFLSDTVLRFVAQADLRDDERVARLGYLAFGEFIYAGSDEHLTVEDWMEVHSPSVPVTFPITSLISRRAFVFARAGFGKSNLMKLLLAELYDQPPTERIAGEDVPVGTLVFDPEGEYFWPDYRDRPGLADVPALRERLVVFTDRQPPSATYGSFVAGPVRFDLRRLHARKVTKIAFTAEKIDLVNVQALHDLSDSEWANLVDAVYDRRNEDARDLLHKVVTRTRKGPTIDTIVDAALGNARRLVRDLHDPRSALLEDLRTALGDGKVCVVDLSLMRGKAGNNLAGVVLDHFFEYNQAEFTKPGSRAIPIIAVIEEAQSVLSSDDNTGDSGPFVAWTKEGRKYALGSILVTQQPGSIPFELLSQADNCFAFHLLSEADLQTLRRANGHFSNDLLASLLNEPIPGSGLVWSSVNQKPYPLPVRILDFQATYPTLLDQERSGESIETFAAELQRRRDQRTAQARALTEGMDIAADATDSQIMFAAYVKAVEARCGDALRGGETVSYGVVMHTQKQVLLDAGWEDDDDRAFEQVRHERLTIPVVEAVAGFSKGHGLEIVDAAKGKGFVVRQH